MQEQHRIYFDLWEESMQALIVVDVQNEFGPGGQRTVPNHAEALVAIERWVSHARERGWPIAWVQHHNKPHESRAFVPGSWGAELSAGLGPKPHTPTEALFRKDVFGAFTATGLEEWLRAWRVAQVTIVGFYAHMCLSTSAREALVRGFDVAVDAAATGARDLEHPSLGRQTADEVRRTALLQLTNLGATAVATPETASAGHDSRAATAASTIA
jgi:nicotinamidase-related amidase